MKTRFLVFGSLVVATSLSAQSTTPQYTAPKITGATPAECLKAANDWRNAEMQGLSTALRNKTMESSAFSAAYAAISKEAQRVTRECAAAFTVESTAAGDLPGLAQVYSFLGDTMQARRAVEKALATPNLTPRQRGQALALAMSQDVARNASHFGILTGAEAIIAQIDALPDSLADIKIAAHQSMLGRYGYLDVAEGLQNHSLAVLRLARQSKMPQYMASAYLSLARSFADRLQADSALAILDRAEKELVNTPRVTETFKSFRDRYALIGTRAAPIPGKWWLNAPDAASTYVPGNGRIAFIEFTAHWCGPCKNSYPGVKQLGQRFANQPFDVVMVTSLYGYLGEQRNLSPEEEVAADLVYFTKKEGLPFRVAINESSMREVDVAYRVGGIPQIMIVDQRGLIRQIVTGWDHGNTERIGRYVEQLLKETPPKT